MSQIFSQKAKTFFDKRVYCEISSFRVSESLIKCAKKMREILMSWKFRGMPEWSKAMNIKMFSSLCEQELSAMSRKTMEIVDKWLPKAILKVQNQPKNDCNINLNTIGFTLKIILPDLFKKNLSQICAPTF
jgi:hypothetical protein